MTYFEVLARLQGLVELESRAPGACAEGVALLVARMEEGLEAEADAAACAHSWVYSGTAYGGDDESYGGEGRCYCEFCGEDGDA